MTKPPILLPLAVVRVSEERRVLRHRIVFLDLVDEFNAGERGRCVIESLEPQHRSHSLLYATGVLFNDSVQITVRLCRKSCWHSVLVVSLGNRCMCSCVPMSYSRTYFGCLPPWSVHVSASLHWRQHTCKHQVRLLSTPTSWWGEF